MGNHVKSFYPIYGRKTGLEKEGANNVVDGAKHTFGFAILLGGVRARETELNSMVGEESRNRWLSYSLPLSHWKDLMVCRN